MTDELRYQETSVVSLASSNSPSFTPQFSLSSHLIISIYRCMLRVYSIITGQLSVEVDISDRLLSFLVISCHRHPSNIRREFDLHEDAYPPSFFSWSLSYRSLRKIKLAIVLREFNFNFATTSTSFLQTIMIPHILMRKQLNIKFSPDFDSNISSFCLLFAQKIHVVKFVLL
jgi:hypothetical protein